MSMLLSPVEIANLSLKNRVVMAPMCMYEVRKKDGIVTPFHMAHYGARAISQVGLIMIEATAVDPDGRISDYDLGLWNNQQIVGLKALVESLHFLGTKVGIQLAHAGRKAKDAVQPIAPSPLAFNKDFATPKEMSLLDIKDIQDKFIEAANRAVEAGVDMIEIHGAHGYLINQFLSPATNKRQDQYGGSLENRYRFLEEIIGSVRHVYKGSLWVRLSLTDFLEAGQQNSIEEWQTIGKWLERDGVDCIDVSAGGVTEAKPNFPICPGYQVHLTMAMKEAVTIPVTAVGLLAEPGICEYILQNNQADLILQGRALIRNVNWLADAAKELKDKEFQVFNQSYFRGQHK
ncbi:oxidoreductase [Granulicatella seriolae]|uniref:NADH:flavin oxidoreductase/NADH oxidase n=1 Tax=Granulicatella seriolae TaxID=2967226 RepID=A0ABT1WLD3_9LACT|nr:NADH:flavin oxidoreductase/NADH oxidase [Granulicatella seriolae]